MAIGEKPTYSGLGWNSNLDDARIYNTALSATDVSNLYNNAGATWQVGTTSITASNNINLDLMGTTLNVSSGHNLTLSAANALNGASVGTLGGASANGNITLTENSLSLTSVPTIQTTGNITVNEHTAGTTIGVGTNATGSLNLNDTFLSDLSSYNTLTIGDSNAGAIDINTATTIANKNLTVSGDGTIYLDKSGDTSPQTLTKNGGGTTTLTLEAGTDIVDNGAISSSGSSNLLNVLFDSDTLNGGGAINVTGNITSNGGYITLGGDETTPTNIVAGTGYAVGDASSTSTAVSNSSNFNAGVVIKNASLNSGAGNIIINGSDSGGAQTSGVDTGIYFGGTGSITTTSGNTSLNGIGGSGSSGFNFGLTLDGGGEV